MNKEWYDEIGNPLEFLEYIEISDPLKGQVKFEQWSHLVEALGLFLTNRLIIILKARQIGFSWLLAVYAVWVAYTKQGANILLISKGEREAVELLSKCRTIYENLPDWMKVYTISPDSATAFGFLETRSKITALPSTEAAGRGEAATLIICDELDYHEYAEKNFASTKPAIDAGGQFIAVFTTNKAEPDSFAKRLFKDARKGLNNFVARFYGYKCRPGRDEEWYQRQRVEYLPYQLEQEYPSSEEEALSPMAATSCFDEAQLKLLWENSGEPIEIKRNFIYIFQKPNHGFLYGAGVDIGEGRGLDYSCLTIAGKYGLQSEVVALIYSNTIGTGEFAYEVDKLCREYFNSLLLVENTGIGLAVINRLLESNYPKLYYSGETVGKKKAGWTSSEGRKRTAFEELVPAIDKGTLITRFKPQIQELMEYQWNEKMKYVPTGRTHGDTVISLMLANQALKNIRPASGTKVTYPPDDRRQVNYERRSLRY